MPDSIAVNVVRIAIEIPFICFHLSVVLCIVVQAKRGNAFFKSGFFAIYVAQSIADIVHYSSSVFILRLPRAGLLVTTVSTYPFGSLAFTFVAYGLFFQFISHATIALNRYCVIANKYTSTWKADKLCVTIIIMVLLPLPGAGIRMAGDVVVTPVDNSFTVALETSPALKAAQAWPPVTYSLVTCVVSIVAELKTVMIYRGLSKSVRQRYAQDYKLLFYALLQLVSQILFAVYYSLLWMSPLIQSRVLVVAVQSTHPYLVELMCFSAPICLFSTSSVLRKAYRRMYLRPFDGFYTTSTSISHVSARRMMSVHG